MIMKLEMMIAKMFLTMAIFFLLGVCSVIVISDFLTAAKCFFGNKSEMIICLERDD